MTWSESWSGLGPVQASSVKVIGTNSEVDILVDQGGSPPPAEIVFRNPSDATVQVATIFGQQTLHNAMGIQLSSGQDTNTRSADILVSPDYLNLEHLNTAGPFTTRIKLLDGAIRVIGTIIVEGETWHNVSFQNGWSQLASYLPASYRKGPENNVEFRGSIRAGTVTDGTTLFTLPAGYVPQGRVLLRPPVGPTGSGTASARLFIQSVTDSLPGAVQAYGLGTGVTDLGLDGLGFSLDA